MQKNKDYNKLYHNDKTTASPTVDPVYNAALNDLNGLYDSLMNSLFQVNSTTGVIGSAAVVQGLALAQLVSGYAGAGQPAGVKPYILLATVVSAGGTMEDHKSFWTNLYRGDHIKYSGGVIVSTALWRSGDAAPTYADVLVGRADFLEFN